MNAEFTKTNLPAVVEGQPGKSDPGRQEAPRAGRTSGDQVFEAHVLGQSGQKRGLKGGQPVLDTARAAYLDTEWRGADDRRLPPGALRRVVL